MFLFSEGRPTATRTSASPRVPCPLTIFVAFLCALAFPTANPTLAQTQGDDVVRVTTDLLLFPVRIRDKKGQPVSALTESSLKLSDPDKVTSGLYFLPGADHVALLFALDRSGSLRQIISQQRDAALSLYEHFSSRSNVAVLTFAENATLVAPFERETSAASNAFRFAPAVNQHTAIFDAAASALKAFDKLPPNRTERRIVILISDGLDNASRLAASDVIDAANEKHVSFYVIHLPLFEPRDGHLAVRPPAKGFRELGQKTGGRYFLVGDVKSALIDRNTNDLTSVFQAIEDDLRSQYLLGFYLNESARDGRRHTFSVSLIPSGIEYSVRGRDYGRTQKFFVNNPAGALAPH